MANSDRLTELNILYLRNMQKIKWRLNAISEIRSKKKTTTYEHTNIEFCALQIRKILELIAFSSLISNVDIYNEKLNNIKKMWNAELILKDIERIHPDFYPKAIYVNPRNKEEWLERSEPCLTRDKFVKAYNKCGKYLHEASPFLTDEQISSDYSALWTDIGVWGQLIINLLYTHVVHLYDQKTLFYITMGEPNTSPRGNIFRAIEDE